MALPPPHAARRPARQRARWAVVAAAALAAGCSDGPDAGAGAPVVAQFGGVGTGPGQFFYPRAIDSDGQSLWVIDKSARVQRLDPATGGVLAGWTMPEFRNGKPCGVTASIGPDGRPAVYVADTHCYRVMVYSVPGKPEEPPALLAQFGKAGRGPGEFIYPTDVAVRTSGPAGASERVERIYVSEYGGNDRVSAFDSDHRFLFSFGSPDAPEDVGPEAIRFNRPQSLALDAARDRLIVTDACNHRLGVFDPDGRLIRWIGSRETAGKEPGRFNYPYGLALCADGAVLVTEFGNHRIQRIDVSTGESRAIYCSMGRGEGEVLCPWGVAMIDSTAYVLDSGNNRVLGLDLSRGRGRLAAGGPAR